MESVVKKNKLPLVESRSRGSKSFDISGAVNNVESLRECAGSGLVQRVRATTKEKTRAVRF